MAYKDVIHERERLYQKQKSNQEVTQEKKRRNKVKSNI